MGMPAPPSVTTIDELLALPEDGLRHELLDGVHVVTPSPAYVHQRVHSRLWWVLKSAISDREDLEALSSPADIYLGPRTLVQPDLLILAVPAQAPAPVTWKDLPTPLLAVEILSPVTAARDRGVKRRLYLGAGVEEYWIVDIDARLIERWRPGDDRPEMVEHELRWELSVGSGGVVDVQSLFMRL
jgi:Uma2 family endonuclease